MVKAVIFDVDGTLLDTERIYVRAWKEAGTLFGYAISDAVLLRTRAISSLAARKIYLEALGEDFPMDAVREARVRIAEALIAETADLCKPGAEALLDALQARGLPVAAATSTARVHSKAHLIHAGLWERFDAVVCGDMVERGKPAPDIFLKAAQLLGAEPADCLVVGDTPADVKAASAAGMPVVLIPDLVPANAETTALSLAVLQDLSQVLPLIGG